MSVSFRILNLPFEIFEIASQEELIRAPRNARILEAIVKNRTRKHKMPGDPKSQGEEARTMKYKLVLHRSQEGYSVWVPDLPGCCSQGEAEVETISNIEIAAQEYLSAVEDILDGGEVREIEVAV